MDTVQPAQPQDEVEVTLRRRIVALKSEIAKLEHDLDRNEKTLAAHRGIGVLELRKQLKAEQKGPAAPVEG